MSKDISSENTKKLVLSQANIETVDSALYDYLEQLNIFCNTINGWNKIPVIWSSAERAYQIKNNKNLRDANGSLIPPIISIERTSITKDVNKKGNFQANLSPKEDSYYITSVLNQEKTSDNANADSLKRGKGVNFVTSKKNNKKVLQHLKVSIPIYITVEYKINILTNFQTQMNDAMQPFMSKTAQGYFIIKKDDYRFECFIDPNFNQESIADLSEEERKFKSTITIKVLGQLVGEGVNQEKPNIEIQENAVSLAIPTETLVKKEPLRVRKTSIVEKINTKSDIVKIKRNALQDSANKQTKAIVPSSSGTEKSNEKIVSASNIETIDSAFYDYLEKLNIFCNTFSGWNKVPLIWSSAERAYQIKNNKNLRDSNGSLITPIISLERGVINKDPTKKGNFQSNLSPTEDRFYVTKLLNQEKTSNFANADSQRKNSQINFVTSKKNKKLVYESYAVRIPVYIVVEYKINVLTSYQMQMNEIVQTFMSRNAQNYFIISKDEHRYECFMNPDFAQESINDLGEEERKFKSVITVRVHGYLMGEGVNELDKNVNIFENAVEIKFPKEKIIIDGEEPKKKKRKEIAGGYVETPAETTSGTIKKTFIVGNGIDAIFIINHGMNTRDAYVSVRENNAPFYQVIAHVEFPSLNSIEVDVGDIIDENSHVVTIIG